MDARLDVQFCWTEKRWKVVEWVTAFQRWSLCFYWKGPNGEYRPLPDTAEPLLRQLERDDWSKYGQRPDAVDLVNRDLSGPREAFVRRRAQENAVVARDYLADYCERSEGVRQTFGSGGALRSRKFVSGGSEHHREYWRGRLAETKRLVEKAS